MAGNFLSRFELSRASLPVEKLVEWMSDLRIPFGKAE
jgi:hypothetical protein